VWIELPPVQTYLLGLIHGTDQQADTDREQLHIGQGNADIPGDDQTFIKHPVENVY
jgi:hypothetical protein